MQEIPLFPLSNALFPDGVVHLRVFEVRYLDMIRRCIAEGSEFGVVGLLSGSEVRTPEGVPELAAVGTCARIQHWEAPMPALLTLSCVGTTRFRLYASRPAKYGLWMGMAEPLAAPVVQPVPPELQPAADALGQLIAGMQREGLPAQAMPVAPPFRLDESGWVADRWCELLPLPQAEKAELLALDDPIERLRRVQAALSQP
ncbi:LON peptidase substrate-binding domain-containing protein [Bordetella sp. 2513F-2]